jgi:signal peptidase II
VTSLWIAIAVAVSDQLTKQWVRNGFALGESRPVIEGFFDLTYVRNTGAAWGMFSNYSWALIALSLVMLILMLVFRKSFLSDTWEHRVAYGLLIGGIAGNLFDRIRLGAVTDFLDFNLFGYPWPSFNIADSAICVGVFIYILSAFWIAGHPLNEDGVSAA